MILDEFGIDIAAHRSVQLHGTIIQLYMTIGADTNNIIGVIGAVVGIAQRLYVVSLGVRSAVSEKNTHLAYLALIISVCLYAAS